MFKYNFYIACHLLYLLEPMPNPLDPLETDQNFGASDVKSDFIGQSLEHLYELT